MSPTDRSVALRRTAEMAAVFMIGDGLLGLLQPVRHVDLWRSRIASVDALVRPFAGRPIGAESTARCNWPPGWF